MGCFIDSDDGSFTATSSSHPMDGRVVGVKEPLNEVGEPKSVGEVRVNDAAMANNRYAVT